MGVGFVRVRADHEEDLDLSSAMSRPRVVLLVRACNGIPFRGPEQDEGHEQKRDPLVPLDERMLCHKAVEDERGSLEWIGYAVAEGDDEVEVSGIEEPALEAPVFLNAACPDDLDLVADDLTSHWVSP